MSDSVTIEGIIEAVKAAKAVRYPLRVRVHPETITALRAAIAAAAPSPTPWIAPPLGVPVVVDLDVSPGEFEWDYPEERP